MMNRMSFIVCAAVIAIAGMAANEYPCSCGGSGPPCQEVWNADAVFAGTVRAIEPVDHDAHGQPYRSVLVKIDVQQAFVNSAPGPIEIITAADGPSCGYAFTVGKQYLVYARKTAGAPRYSTSICSRTRLLESAEEDLGYLRTLPSAGAGGRIYGRINEWTRHPAEEQGADNGPLENVVVSVRGAAFSREAATDRHGRYDISGLSAGELTLSVHAPLGFESRHLEREVELKDLRACTENNFTLSKVATASGTIADAAGNPIAGVEVDAVAAELAGYEPPQYHSPVRTDARGRFEFERLPPGEYVFGVNLTKRFGGRPGGRPTFFPGTAAAREAAVIELTAGDRKDVGVLRLVDR